MARPSLALALLMALALAPERPARADDALVKQFAAEYREKLPTLIERYVKNRKVRIVRHEYRSSHPFPDDPLGKKEAEIQTTSVSDGTNVRIESQGDSPHDRGHWFLLRPMDLVEVTKNKDRTIYVVADHRSTSSDIWRAGVAQDRSGLYLALGNTAFVLDAINAQDESSKKRWSILSVTQTTWRGYHVKAVRVQLDQHLSNRTITNFSTAYLDTDNDLIFRGSESQNTSQEGELSNYVSELSYTASPDGYPMPSRSESHRMMPDGSKIPSLIIEVKEYSRYTPLPEEFTLAQFGLAEPALDAPVPIVPAVPTLPAPRRHYIWVFVAAGVVFALVAGALYWRWRRPRQSPTPTRSSV